MQTNGKIIQQQKKWIKNATLILIEMYVLGYYNKRKIDNY